MKKLFLTTLPLMTAIFITFSYASVVFAGEPQDAPRSDSHPGFQQGGEKMKQRHQAMKKVMIHKWLEKEMPEFLEKVKTAEEEYPEAVQSFKKDMKKSEKQRLFQGPARGKMDDQTKAIMQEFLENELESYVLSQKYKESTDERERENLKSQLENVLSKSFELKAQIQETMIAKMEDRIQKLRDLLANRKAIKNQIITDRIETITNDSELTKW